MSCFINNPKLPSMRMTLNISTSIMSSWVRFRSWRTEWSYRQIHFMCHPDAVRIWSMFEGRVFLPFKFKMVFAISIWRSNHWWMFYVQNRWYPPRFSHHVNIYIIITSYKDSSEIGRKKRTGLIDQTEADPKNRTYHIHSFNLKSFLCSSWVKWFKLFCAIT